MRILQKYYLTEFVKAFLLLSAGLSTLITLISSFKSSTDIALMDAGLRVLVEFSLMEVPGSIVSIMPVTALVAALLTVGQASGSLELVAVTSGGGRLRTVMRPLLLTGVVLSLASFLLGEAVMPAAAKRALKIMNRAMGLDTQVAFAGGVTWLRAEDGAIVRLGVYSTKTDSYSDVSLYRMNEGKLVELMDAGEAKYIKDKKLWRFNLVKTHEPASGRGAKIETLDYPGLPEPSDIAGGRDYTARMGAFELIRYLGRLKAAGFDNPELRMELHNRFASPVLNFIMVIIGVSIAAGRSVGALKAGAIGLVITALYWLTMSLSSALGLAGVMPHFVAAWATPVVFLALAGVLYMRMQE